jgi:hypothetical protein
MLSPTGLAADPFTGHLFVSTLSGNDILNVDPIGKTQTHFVSASADGLALSNDGTILYGAVLNGHILGWSTATGAQVFDSGFISGGPDGVAVGTGAFAGELLVNTNGGNLYEINETTLAQALIATGGSRGDFVTVDPTNGTFLITQSDRIMRLSGPSSVPEPSSIWLLGAVIAATAISKWRRVARQN